MNEKHLRGKLQEIYLMHDLNTVCCRQCSCCRVACPQMKYSEALNIIQRIWEEWTQDDKAKLLSTCIRYFFSRSLIKPCPLLSEKNCRIYEDRPVNCRIYGLWPKEVYEKRVSGMSRIIDLPAEQIPLNVQCPHVLRKNEQSPLTTEQTEQIFKALDKLDKDVGKLKDEQLATYWNYRTLHDWALFIFFGEQWLMNMTHYALSAKKEDLDAFLIVLDEQVKLSVGKLEVKKPE